MLRYVNLNINNDENKNKSIFIKTLYSHFNSLNATHSRIYKSLSLFIQNVRTSHYSGSKTMLFDILFLYNMAFPQFYIKRNDSTRKLQ